MSRAHAHTAAHEVALLHFCVGTQPLAIAARGVDIMDVHNTQHPHIGELLGVDERGEVSARRTLLLADGTRRVGLEVDGPVRMGRCRSIDIQPKPPSLPLRHKNLVLGFTLDADQKIVTLLDLLELVGLINEKLQPVGCAEGRSE